MGMFQNFRNVIFSEIKAPQGATRRKGALEKLPQLNEYIFITKSKSDFPQKHLMEITYQTHCFTENQNGPYGP